MSDISLIQPLTLNQRETAFERATVMTAGDEVTLEKFKYEVPSKYPKKLTRVMLAVAGIFMVAMFIPSSIRLFKAGQIAFCEMIERTQETMDLEEWVEQSCSAVGVSTVIMAETGQIAFFFALALLARDRSSVRIYWTGVFLTSVIALVGNAYISPPWENGGFVWLYLETFVPTILLSFLGYALKNYILHSVEEQHGWKLAFEEARVYRQKLMVTPELAGDLWWRNLSLCLREAIRSANPKQKELLQSLPGDAWRYLVKREMQAAQWTVRPEDLTQIERNQISGGEVQGALPAPVNSFEPPALVSESEFSSSELWEGPEGGWWARSKLTHQLLRLTPYPKKFHATNALKNHYRSQGKGKSET